MRSRFHKGCLNQLLYQLSYLGISIVSL